jgi:hypothetical protein
VRSPDKVNLSWQPWLIFARNLPFSAVSAQFFKNATVPSFRDFAGFGWAGLQLHPQHMQRAGKSGSKESHPHIKL